MIGLRQKTSNSMPNIIYASWAKHSASKTHAANSKSVRTVNARQNAIANVKNAKKMLRTPLSSPMALVLRRMKRNNQTFRACRSWMTMRV